MHPVPPLASHSLLVFLAAIAVLLAVARLLGGWPSAPACPRS